MGKTTETIKVLKGIRSKYEVGSAEFEALTTSIKSMTEWGSLNAEIDNLGIWGFEDVPARFQILKAFKDKMHTVVHKKLREVGIR